MGKKYDVIGIENMIMDFSFLINRIPETDKTAVIKDYCFSGGGNASSAVVALARLGAVSAIIGTAGNDIYGDFCVKDMAANHVDVSHIKRIDGETTLCVCLAETETSGRSFLGKPGTNGVMMPWEVDENFIKDTKIIHLSCIPSSAQKIAVEFAKKNNIEISLDAGAPVLGSEALAEQADIIIMSESFYHGIFGNDTNYCDNCRTYLQKGAHTVIVTLGRKGCAGINKNEEFTLEAFSGDMPIVDTTGAGDVFHGGFLYAYLYRYQKQPYHYNLSDCARFASAVSYINCMTLGGRPGIPTLSMVDKFLKTGVIEDTDIKERKYFYRHGLF